MYLFRHNHVLRISIIVYTRKRSILNLLKNIDMAVSSLPWFIIGLAHLSLPEGVLDEMLWNTRHCNYESLYTTMD